MSAQDASRAVTGPTGLATSLNQIQSPKTGRPAERTDPRRERGARYVKAMRLLGVRCKACGRIFGMGMLVPVYGRPMFAPLSCTCPVGHHAVYTSAECVEVRA